jgi:hypothetical protein
VAVTGDVDDRLARVGVVVEEHVVVEGGGRELRAEAAP